MRNLLWIIVAVLVIGGGYLLFTGKSVGDITGTSGAPAEAGDTAAE